MAKKARWLSELDTYRTIKTSFILEGEINDLQLWEEDGYTTLLSLNTCLFEYLKNVGYKCIVFYNRVDGFYNEYDENGEMLATFYKASGLTSPAAGISMQKAIAGIRKAMANSLGSLAVIMNLSSLLASSPEHLQPAEIENFANLFLCGQKMNGGDSSVEGEWLNNILFYITNKANNLPVWLYIDNPYAKVLNVAKPTSEMRMDIFKAHIPDFYDWNAIENSEREKIIKQLVGITDGFTCLELDGVLALCGTQKLRLREAYSAINAYRYGQKEDLWEELTGETLRDLQKNLSKQVIGQEKAVAAVTDIIKRAACGLSGLQHSSATRPRGVMFFAGPTGTGKTELAKTLARYIFGDESALIRFDMSEYSHAHSDQRLLGAPPGYVGYNEGGELTNAVKSHPFSILLFDEIEKADPTILDKFLQILDDGRLTDSKGETVYFTETIIIFTSNKGIYREIMDPDNPRKVMKESIVKPGDNYDYIEKSVKSAIHEYFVSDLGKPEILNRIGNNLVVFNFIQESWVPAILNLQINNIFRNLREKKRITLRLSETSHAFCVLKDKSIKNLEFGGRGIGNVVEKYLSNPLGRIMSDENWKTGDMYEIQDIIEGDMIQLICNQG